MVSKRLRVVLPSHRLEEPLLARAAQESGALISIIRAQAAAERYEIVFEVEGEPEQVTAVIAYLEGQQVTCSDE